MITSEQKHLKEIEIERLWMTTNQSKVVFIGMLPISILLVVGLWDMESHNLLIIWLAIVTTLNFFRWMYFRFYHNHKESFIGSVLQYKRILITSSLLTGFCWGLAVVWFF